MLIVSREPRYICASGGPQYIRELPWTWLLVPVGIRRLKTCQKRTSKRHIHDRKRWIRRLGRIEMQKKIAKYVMVFENFVDVSLYVICFFK